MMYLKVSLKICEGCGNLWFRAENGTTVYCGSCAKKLESFPIPRLRRRPGGRRKKDLQVVAGGAR